jgi:hypothetical protein
MHGGASSEWFSSSLADKGDGGLGFLPNRLDDFFYC